MPTLSNIARFIRTNTIPTLLALLTSGATEVLFVSYRFAYTYPSPTFGYYLGESHNEFRIYRVVTVFLCLLLFFHSLRGLFSAWLGQMIEGQIATVRKHVVTTSILEEKLLHDLSKYVTKDDLQDQNFVPTKDLQNAGSNIRKVLKRQYEDMFFRKDKIKEQLATHLKGSVTKALIDESLKGSREDIDDLKKLATAHLTILAQTQKNGELAQKLIGEIADAQADVNADHHRRLKDLEQSR